VTEAELLAAVYDAPDADEPRRVYADWLQERGHPRGELIALQFARHDGTASLQSLARERELLRQHIVEWSGPLWSAATAKRNIAFERGFAERLVLAQPRLLPPLPGHPCWATLRTLVAPNPPHWLRLAFCVDDRLRGLFAFFNCPLAVALQLATDPRPRRLHTLALAPRETQPPSLHADDELRDLVRPALVDGRGLPELRHLELRAGFYAQRPDSYDWLWSSSLGARLETLVLHFLLPQPPRVEPWLAAALPSNLRTIGLIAERALWLGRGADGRFAPTGAPAP
jgi:uncharacterized protein (TIGR02996 family)